MARGEDLPGTDVDLLYMIQPGARLGSAINRLEDELSRLFGRRVDLVSKRALNPRLRDAVLADARTLHAA